jgi:hypothetical protein
MPDVVATFYNNLFLLLISIVLNVIVNYTFLRLEVKKNMEKMLEEIKLDFSFHIEKQEIETLVEREGNEIYKLMNSGGVFIKPYGLHRE